MAPRAVLLGWYGSENTGDEAVLEAIVSSLRQRGIEQIHALSTNPTRTSARLGITSSSRSLLDTATLRALRRADILILGGGGLIQDRTSIYNLPIYAAFTLAARLLGLKVAGWGLGVEPLDTPLGRFLARLICRSSAYFSVRDPLSRRLLGKAGVSSSRVQVTADPAYALDIGVANTQVREGAAPVVVFSLRDLPDNRPGLNLDYVLPVSIRRRLGRIGKSDPGRAARFSEAVARGVKVCVEEFGAQVRFVALWPGRDEDVIRAVIRTAESMGVPPESMALQQGVSTPAGVATSLEGAAMLVGMRLHALIFGSRHGVPAVALAYARKMRSLMALLGMERWVVEVETRTPAPDEIEMKIRQLWQQRTEQAEAIRLAARAAEARAQADADAVASLLTSRPRS